MIDVFLKLGFAIYAIIVLGVELILLVPMLPIIPIGWLSIWIYNNIQKIDDWQTAILEVEKWYVINVMARFAISAFNAFLCICGANEMQLIDFDEVANDFSERLGL